METRIGDEVHSQVETLTQDISVTEIKVNSIVEKKFNEQEQKLEEAFKSQEERIEERISNKITGIQTTIIKQQTKMREEDRLLNEKRETRQLEQIQRMFQLYVSGNQREEHDVNRIVKTSKDESDNKEKDRQIDERSEMHPYEQAKSRPPPDPNRMD